MIRTVLFTAALALAASAQAAPKPPPAPAIPPEPGAPAAADWRTPDPENLMVIDTNKGRIIVELTPQIAPNHVARVKELTRAGVYDNRTFFRVIDQFMAQTGDPKDDGTVILRRLSDRVSCLTAGKDYVATGSMIGGYTVTDDCGDTWSVMPADIGAGYWEIVE